MTRQWRIAPRVFVLFERNLSVWALGGWVDAGPTAASYGDALVSCLAVGPFVFRLDLLRSA